MIGDSAVFRATLFLHLPKTAVNNSLPDSLVRDFLEGSAQLSASKVMTHCRARLEDYKVPQQVEFRESLPMNISGKVVRKELR